MVEGGHKEVRTRQPLSSREKTLLKALVAAVLGSAPDAERDSLLKADPDIEILLASLIHQTVRSHHLAGGYTATGFQRLGVSLQTVIGAGPISAGGALSLVKSIMEDRGAWWSSPLQRQATDLLLTEVALLLLAQPESPTTALDAVLDDVRIRLTEPDPPRPRYYDPEHLQEIMTDERLKHMGLIAEDDDSTTL
jgi:hypothetical protein